MSSHGWAPIAVATPLTQTFDGHESNMRRKWWARRRGEVFAILAVLLAASVVGAWDIEYWSNLLGLHKSRNRATITRFYETLSLGTNHDDVLSELSRPTYSHIQYMGCDRSVCVVSSPVEFGAGHWVIYLRFDGDKLSAAHVGTGDSALDYPDGAPPDLGTWTIESSDRRAAEQVDRVVVAFPFVRS